MALKVGIVGLTNTGKQQFSIVFEHKSTNTEYSFSTNKSTLEWLMCQTKDY
jgi:ribosome-binding ATPase YchF (GTP1/OBG family)